MFGRLSSDLCAEIARFLDLKLVMRMACCSRNLRAHFNTDRAWRLCYADPRAIGIIPDVPTSERFLELRLGVELASSYAVLCFRTACLRGWQTKAGWATCTLHGGAGFGSFLYCELLVGACNNGHLAMAQWLLSRPPFQFVSTHIDWFDLAFVSACSNGHLNVAAWIAQQAKADRKEKNRPGPTFPGVCMVKRSAIAAAKAGHLEVIQWLNKVFIAPLRPVLLAAAAWGQTAVVRWLVTQDDIRHMRVPKALQLKTLRVAFAHNHIGTVQTVATLFNLLPRDLSRGAQKEFDTAIRQKRFELARWIAATEPRSSEWSPLDAHFKSSAHSADSPSTDVAPPPAISEAAP